LALKSRADPEVPAKFPSIAQSNVYILAEPSCKRLYGMRSGFVFHFKCTYKVPVGS